MRQTVITVLILWISITALAFAGGQTEGEPSGRILPNPTGTRLVDEPIQMTAIVKLESPHTVTNPDELPFMQFIQEQTGVDWVFDAAVGEDAYMQKLNLTFASGDLPDVVYSGVQPQYRSFILEQSSVGNIIPLNDLIEKYAPNIKAILAEREDIRRMLTLPDGKIYSLFSAIEEEHYNWVDSQFINHTWLERVGKSVPTTVEELRDVLMAFKTQDANGNGDPNDEIPMSTRETGWAGCRIDSFFGAFGIHDSKDDNHIGVENGKAFVTAADDRYRRALEFFHELYADGLLDPESFTQSTPQLRAKAQNNQVGVFIWFNPMTITGLDLIDEYSLLPPLSSDFSPATAYLTKTVPGFVGYRFMITKSNPYPEVAMRYADLLMDRADMSLSAGMGEEGHFWEKLPGGRWTLNYDKIPEGLGVVQHRAAATLYNQAAFIDRELWRNYEGGPETIYVKRTNWWAQLADLEHGPALPVFWFSRMDGAEVARIATDLTSYVAEMRARFILEGVTDRSWNEYVSNIEKIGAAKLIEIYQKAYEDYYK
jgi:putative aldouronate transport system substrate-binding protein